MDDRILYEGTVVRHFKGNMYVVINPDVYDTETGERMVLYTGLYSEQWWVRPYDMFMSKVDKEKYPDVEQEYRFEIVED